MFIVSEFEEIVKVQPNHLEDDQVSRIVIHLNTMLANKVVMNVGLCLSLFDIQEIGDSIIYPSEGAYFCKVRFRFIVFRCVCGITFALNSPEFHFKISARVFTDHLSKKFSSAK